MVAVGCGDNGVWFERLPALGLYEGWSPDLVAKAWRGGRVRRAGAGHLRTYKAVAITWRQRQGAKQGKQGALAFMYARFSTEYRGIVPVGIHYNETALLRWYFAVRRGISIIIGT